MKNHVACRLACHPEGGFATEGSTLPRGRFFATLRFAQNDSVRSLPALIAVVAALLPAALLLTGLAEVARAAITTSGSVTGTGTPYNGTDNPWATGNLVVADNASGSMTIEGGFVVNNTGPVVFTKLFVGTTGTVTVDGAGSTWTNSGSLTMSYGTATLNITGGGSVSNTSADVGIRASSRSTVTVGGGTGASTWTNSGALTVGNAGTGKLDITGGGSVSNTSGRIGGLGNGTVTVGGGTGASTWTNSGTLNVGQAGTGRSTLRAAAVSRASAVPLA
jgi:fibronectin-binding autotransporter adhesin